MRKTLDCVVVPGEVGQLAFRAVPFLRSLFDLRVTIDNTMTLTLPDDSTLLKAVQYIKSKKEPPPAISGPGLPHLPVGAYIMITFITKED
jgi:hypothetical protein